MVKFANNAMREQFQRADWRIRVVAHRVAEELELHHCHFTVTGIERTFTRTKEIYLAAGKPPPSQPGVHDVRPCRGLDGVPTPKRGHEVNILSVGPLVEGRINGLFRYPRARNVCLWHSVSGIHLHLQVPWDPDGLPMLPDTGGN